MKLVNIKELKVGDVFAKEIKVKGRESFRVTDVPANKNYIMVLQRGGLNPVKMATNDGLIVYYLRKDI